MKIVTRVLLIGMMLLTPTFLFAWSVQNGVAVCTMENNQYYSTSYYPRNSVVSDNTGGAIIAWNDHRVVFNSGDIYVQRLNNLGVPLWKSDGVAICTTTEHQTGVQVVSDVAGGAFMTWHDYRNTNPGQGADIYVQHINSEGSTLWAPNGISICTANGDQIYPQIVSDGFGGAVIVWNDKRNDGIAYYPNYYNLYVQRINSAGSTLWTLNGVMVSSCLVHYPQLVSDGTGGVIITWMNLGYVLPNGTTSDIYAQHINSQGSTLWSLQGTAICTANYEQWEPKITSDGVGGAIIVWSDERFGAGRAYAQRVNSTGSTLWLLNGVALCTANSSNQGGTPTISDGLGGAFVVWDDYRKGMSCIYAQHINSQGSTLWDLNGIPINTTGSTYAQIVPDNFGGAIITWEDYRNNLLSDSDIYAQRISNLGSTLWALNGIPICTSIGAQRYAELISDQSGNTIVTWMDYRNDNNGSDIYAQQIDSNGFMGIPTSIPKQTWELMGE